MTLFSGLLLKLIPLYVIIALGFVARRYHTVDRETISKILIYLIVPFVFFAGAMHTPVTLGNILMPFIVAGICTVLCLTFYAIGKHYWTDNTPNLLGMTSGNANTGYFGLPIAMMLFDETGVGLYLTIMLGFSIYENTIGFFIIARGAYTAREAIAKLLRLPALYAFALGIVLHATGLNLPLWTLDFFTSMRGAYTVLGMMVIGMGLAGVVIHHIDWRFIGLSFLAKFVAFPLLCMLFLGIDNTMLHAFSPQVHKALLLLSIMPLAANSVVYATLLNAQPEKAAASVFLSTLFAIIYVPLMVAVLITN